MQMMMCEYSFRVGGFVFSVSLPEAVALERLLPSFLPFLVEEPENEERLFSFRIVEEPIRVENKRFSWEDTGSDVGNTRLYVFDGGFEVDLQYTPQGPTHRMWVNDGFSEAAAEVCWEDPWIVQVLTSLIRIVYAQAVLTRQAISVHASVVVKDQKAFLFMGKSGTGKSTHSRLWLRSVPGCQLLNDDNPIVVMTDNGPWVFGSPWSGKTPCYENRQYPIEGIVRLQQAERNRLVLCKDVEAFALLLPGCSVIRKEHRLVNALCSTLVRLVEQVRIGRMECRPDEEAARICYQGLTRENKER